MQLYYMQNQLAMHIYYMIGIGVIVGLIAVSIVFQQYKTSTYYQVTGNSYLSMRFDLGKYGEYLTYKYLRSFEAKGA